MGCYNSGMSNPTAPHTFTLPTVVEVTALTTAQLVALSLRLVPDQVRTDSIGGRIDR